MTFLTLVLLLVAVSMPLTSQAGDAIPSAYQRAAIEHGIPPAILYSIALAESGKAYRGKRLPWPWTVNHAGRGIYFPTRQAAYDYLSQVLSSGQRNFDVGLMQVNWRWNAYVFGHDLWQAFDPYENLRGGASILRAHYDRTGSFEAAVGAYHSPGDATRANVYRERVRKILAGVLAEG